MRGPSILSRDLLRSDPYAQRVTARRVGECVAGVVATLVALGGAWMFLAAFSPRW